MIVYSGTKESFIADALERNIANKIDEAFVCKLGRHTSPNEVRSWDNSMTFMSMVLNDAEIPDQANVAIEYQIPLTAKRVDFIISGADREDNNNVVIVELKQWEKAELTCKPAIVRTRFEHGEAETTHPSYQAWSYAFMLENYKEVVRTSGIRLSPCAYLHNYDDTRDNCIQNPFYQEYLDKAPVFMKHDSLKLRGFIKERVHHPSKENLIWDIDQGRLRPSKQLAEALENMLKGNNEFMLLDEQKLVFETAINLAQLSSKEDRKHVLIVEGGPGTGKSVVAINLLVELAQKGLSAQYVTKNAAPREVYSQKLIRSYRQTYINNLFVGSGKYVDAEKNCIDALVVDEAHRLNMKSGLYSNLGENQIKEIVNAARFSVFFVDDRQRIHINDIGSVRSIKQYAEECGAVVHTAELSSQFRCNGSDGYLSWLDNALQIRDTANFKLTSDDYDFRIFDNPKLMFEKIKELNSTNNKSRVVAGYCWDWKSKRNAAAPDIVIPEFGFQKQWNFQGNTPWLIGEHSIEQIGCIHTCQGLEMDYVGVIIGPDIRYENGRIVTDVTMRSTNDQSVRGFRQLLSNPETRSRALQDADEIIKNTYRTLMTRGMKGCYVYCCDPGLREHLMQMMDTSVEVDEGIRVEDDVNDDVKYVDFLPVMTMRAACGYFGEGDEISIEGWVRVEGMGRLNRNMFVVMATGHSMEPLISDCDLCVFKANPAGSRDGKIVLAQHHGFYDPENHGSFSIKQYRSTKTYDEDGNWMHETIKLVPRNKDYSEIILTEDEIDEFRIIGEFVGTL